MPGEGDTDFGSLSDLIRFPDRNPPAFPSEGSGSASWRGVADYGTLRFLRLSSGALVASVVTLELLSAQDGAFFPELAGLMLGFGLGVIGSPAPGLDGISQTRLLSVRWQNGIRRATRPSTGHLASGRTRRVNIRASTPGIWPAPRSSRRQTPAPCYPRASRQCPLQPREPVCGNGRERPRAVLAASGRDGSQERRRDGDSAVVAASRLEAKIS
jgi:hypothetical protein